MIQDDDNRPCADCDHDRDAHVDTATGQATDCGVCMCMKYINPSQPAPLAKNEATRFGCTASTTLAWASDLADLARAKELLATHRAPDDAAAIARLIRDVRRETIQACAAWLDAQLGANGAFKGFVDGADMIEAMTKKDGEP